MLPLGVRQATFGAVASSLSGEGLTWSRSLPYIGKRFPPTFFPLREYNVTETKTIRIAMNGITGRMGYRQHLLRSILPIRIDSTVAAGSIFLRAICGWGAI